jgi:integrase
MDKIDQFFTKKLYDKPGTMETYRCHITKFFEVNKKDMETYFDKSPPYIPSDPEKIKAYNLYYESDLRKYWEYLKPKAPKTKQTAIASVKQFMKCFDRNTWNLEIWESIQNRLRGKVRPIMEEHVPERTEIKKILQYCDIKTKTAILIALSSGMRISEVMELLPTDVYIGETPTRINIRAETTKTGQRRTTFITPEATELLVEWLRVREDYIRDAYKSLNFKNTQHSKENKKNDPRIFPFQASVIQTAFNNACEMAGFIKTSPLNGDDHSFKHTGRRRQRKTLHFHNLRKFFRSNFGNVDFAEHLMGHSGYLTEYRAYSDTRLADVYQNYQHNLMIFETSPDLSGIYEELRDKEEKIQELTKTKFEVERLRTVVEEMEKQAQQVEELRVVRPNEPRKDWDKMEEQILAFKLVNYLKENPEFRKLLKGM